MKFTLCFILMLSTLNAFSSINERLGNNQLSYYGSEFYSQFPSKISKELLFKILSLKHASNPKGLDNISSSCQGDCYSHSAVGYSQARRILFGELYLENDGKGKFVEDVYCGKKFYFRTVDDISSMGSEVNIEHTWPQSKFSSQFDREMQKSDLHHLFPTDSEANNKRGNHRFGNVNQREDQLNVPQCDDSKLGNQNGDMVFTPPTEHKGNVARAIFYFSIRYKLPITSEEEAVLREWHKNDPVNDQERANHDLIAKHQLTRNPFIDYPELATTIQDF
jgi:deoxyribonuclease-1